MKTTKPISPFENDVTFNNSSLPQFLVDTEYIIIDINSVAIELMKYSKDEIIGKNINNYLDKSYSFDFLKNKALLRKEISNYIVSRVYYDKLGVKQRFDINVSIIDLPESNKKYFLCIFYLQEKKLPFKNFTNKLEVDNLKIILEKSPIMQWVIDFKNNKFLYENRGLLEHLGYNTNDYSFEARSDLFYSKLVNKTDYIKTKDDDQNEFCIYNSKNEIRWIITNSIPLSLDKNREYIIGYGTMQDITQRKNRELRIKKQQEDLDNHNKKLEGQLIKIIELENFVNITSHDLKEPIRSIRNYTQILTLTNKDNLDNDGKKLIKLIKNSTDKIYERIEAILNFSRVTNSIAEYKEIDIKVLIENVIEELKREIEQKQSQVSLKLTNKIIHGEVKQIHQLLKNIISNALKFTKTGTSKIEISLIECKDFWNFSIKDNGIGIPKHEFYNIFKIFKKLHDEEEYKGLGIGLSICKRIIERHQGEIWVESNIDEGSIFHFSISKNIK